MITSLFPVRYEPVILSRPLQPTLKFKKTSFSFFFFQKAEAQLAYELQAAKIQQKIRNEEIQIQVWKQHSFFLVDTSLVDF